MLQCFLRCALWMIIYRQIEVQGPEWGVSKMKLRLHLRELFFTFKACDLLKCSH